MNTKRLHYFSALIIAVFIGLHLFNHLVSVFSAAAHVSVMKSLRLFYRHIVVESILLSAVFAQVISGIKMFIAKRKAAITIFDKIQIWTGLYLVIFFIIHLGAVFMGRLYLHLDTNFYFGVAGLNTFPFSLFFIPYYGLAIISIFGHLAAVHNTKMTCQTFGLSPRQQSFIFLATGMVLTLVIFYGLTNHFHGVTIPEKYNVLIGK